MNPAPDARRSAPRSTRPAEHAEVSAFYDACAFPGYAPSEAPEALLARARRAAFLRDLDAALPVDARVLDAGCGTGQVAAFLALSSASRRVTGVDGSDGALRAASDFRARAGIHNLSLVRGDLFALPLAQGPFDLVMCRGVIHHTNDPRGALASVARAVAPGGYFIVGIYELWARIPHRLRRVLFRLRGGPINALDPVLRRDDLGPDKKRAWYEDQYRHPLEVSLAFPEVEQWLHEEGFEWVRSVPPTAAGARLFEPERRRPGRAWARRLGWMFSGWNNPDAGLVCLVARRPKDQPARD